MNKKIALMLVDDHRIVIDGIKSIFDEQENIEITGEAESGKQALEILKQQQPHVMLIDIHMPDMSGVELARKVKKEFPEIKMLMLTMSDENTLINQSIEAGANGYILKNSNSDELIDAVAKVYEGKKYLSSKAQEVVMNSIYNHQDAILDINPQAVHLTARESEILKLIASEYTNEQIANKLFISERTVETHRKNIFTKTKTKSVVGLIKYAIKQGLIEPEEQS